MKKLRENLNEIDTRKYSGDTDYLGIEATIKKAIDDINN